MSTARVPIYSIFFITVLAVIFFAINPVIFSSLFVQKNAANLAGILILDLDGDGLELSEFSNDTKTFFDLDNDGFAEQTSWPEADDGILALDFNGDGVINSAAELFGDVTHNGFDALAAFDSNRNQAIDRKDKKWSSFLIWKDENQDANTQSTEIRPLSEWGVVKIDIRNQKLETVVRGNTVRGRSHYYLQNDLVREIAAVSFKLDQANSYYMNEYLLDVRALFLPTLRGFGTIKDLHIAISEDPELLEMLQNMVLETKSLEVFGRMKEFDRRAEEIFFRWAGVETVDPKSRGPNIDARKLVFLEKVFGQEFVHKSGSINPPPGAASLINISWQKVFENMRAHLLIQVCCSALFVEGAYDPWKGGVSGSLFLSQTGIKSLVEFAQVAPVGPDEYWREVARFLKYTKKLESINNQESVWISEAIKASGGKSSWQEILYQLKQN